MATKILKEYTLEEISQVFYLIYSSGLDALTQ